MERRPSRLSAARTAASSLRTSQPAPALCDMPRIRRGRRIGGPRRHPMRRSSAPCRAGGAQRSGVAVTVIDFDLTGHESYMPGRLELTDLLIDATARVDLTSSVVPNEWIAAVPEDAVLLDLSASSACSRSPAIRGPAFGRGNCMAVNGAQLEPGPGAGLLEAHHGIGGRGRFLPCTSRVLRRTPQRGAGDPTPQRRAGRAHVTRYRLTRRSPLAGSRRAARAAGTGCHCRLRARTRL